MDWDYPPERQQILVSGWDTLDGTRFMRDNGLEERMGHANITEEAREELAALLWSHAATGKVSAIHRLHLDGDVYRELVDAGLVRVQRQPTGWTKAFFGARVTKAGHDAMRANGLG